MALKRRQRHLFHENLEHRLLLHGDATAGFETFEDADAMANYLVEQALERYAGQFGTTWKSHYYPWHHRLEYNAIGAADASGAADLVSVGSTNVQVAGIDEGDLVETDGRYIYTLTDSGLSVIDTESGLELVDQVSFSERPVEQYLSDDRLTIISQTFGFHDIIVRPGLPIATDALIAPYPFDPELQIRTFDVSDPGNIELISQSTVDGSLVSSRVFEDQLLLVTRDDFGLAGPQYHCSETEQDGAEGESRVLPYPYDAPLHVCTYETKDAYLDRIEGQVLELAMPRVTVEGEDGELLSSPDKTYLPLDEHAHALTSVAFIDTDTGEWVDSISLPSQSTSTIYVTPEAAYLTTAGYPETKISRIAWDDGLALEARGSVPGYIDGSFALDEFEGDLRVMTTTFDQDSSNHLIVLRPDGEELKVIGSVEGLAEGERIFATRFFGEHAFMVTFRQVDPLFSFDLSDPTAPEVVGELKIPGFSDYLHPVAEGLLLGVGQDVDETTGRRNGPLLSLFDVEELSDPTQLDRFTIDSRPNGWSIATYDHHAFTISDDAAIAAIPVQSWDQGSLNELWVFDLFQEGVPDIEHRGTIRHATPISRSLILGDTIYVVSQEEVSAHPLADLDDSITLSLTPIARDDHFVATFSDVTVLDVLLNDGPRSERIDAIRDQLTVTEVGASDAGATISILDNGNIEYTPPAGFFGADEFTYSMTSSTGQTGSATVHVTVMHTIDEDSSFSFEPLANDQAANQTEDDPRIITEAEVIQGDGSVSISADGKILEVTPAADFNGSLVIRYNGGTPADGDELADRFSETVPIQVLPINDPPTAKDDVFRVDPFQEEIQLNLLQNDSSLPDGAERIQLVELSESNQGAVIEILDGSRSVVYRPPANMTEPDQFTYVIEDEDGARSTATVNVIPEIHEDTVAISLHVTDEAGNAIRQIAAGETFWLELRTEDLRIAGTGVFAVFADVEFDPSLTVDGEIEFLAPYANATHGQILEGQLDEVGAAAGLTTLDDEVRSVWRVAMTAAEPGSFTLASNPADVFPLHETLVYGSNDAVPRSGIVFGSTSIEVIPSWQNQENPFDVNDDGVTAPSDALIIINTLNLAGTGEVASVLARADSGPEGEFSRYLDVNGDNRLTASDALQIINWLNANSGSVASGEGEASSSEAVHLTALDQATAPVELNQDIAEPEFQQQVDDYYTVIEEEEEFVS